MGCVSSSPHARRKYRDPADLDEVDVPLRYFGQFRNGSVLVPDDVDGLPSTHIEEHLAGNTEPILYEAVMDNGFAYRCCRPLLFLLFPFPAYWVAKITTGGATQALSHCTCDAVCCWVRKEYSTRSWYRVYTNRITVNQPQVRIPWGCCGCGSWNADSILTHPFDRGAFGFRRVPVGDFTFLCCCWPVYGGAVARQRCQCNGPLWNRMSDCGGWWCDEWLCEMWFCSYRYSGIAYPEEVAFASSIALQAYYEGRPITPDDMHKCVEYWKSNISELHDPEARKRDVCCEPFCVPIPSCTCCYQCTHPERNVPYDDEDERNTKEIQEVYAQYATTRERQVETFKSFYGPRKYSTVCQACGCKRFCGRNGFFFCFEGCCTPSRKAGDPAPPFENQDIDDENDASVVLRKVLGDAPPDVIYKRWEYDEERAENVIVTLQAKSPQEEKLVDVGLAVRPDVESEDEPKPHDE